MVQFPPAHTDPESLDLNATLLLWARPFLEGALWVTRRFGTVGDQDEALLYLAAWQFLMADFAAHPERAAGFGSLPMEEALAFVRPEEFPAAPAMSLVEETGIPRETARRKLAAMARRGLVVARRDGTFQVARATPDILDLALPASGLARWMLSIHGWPPDCLGEPRSLRSFGALARHYLATYLAFLKPRRIHTGTLSHVPVHIALMLVHLGRIESRIALEGPPARWDFAAYIRGSRQAFAEPILLKQVARMCGLSLAEARTTCRRLSEIVTLVDSDTLTLGGSTYRGDDVGLRRFYPVEAEQRLRVFTRRVLVRAARLAAKDAPR